MNENILCTRIGALRRGAGLTQEQLAGRLGISFQAVSKWENSQSCPDIMLLPSLADIFGVSIDSLFGRESPVRALAPAAPDPGTERALPWPDDDGLYVALYQGHRLISEPEEDMDLTFTYSGPAVNVNSAVGVVCEDCEIRGDVSAAGDVNCGAVGGSVNAGGDVSCDGVGGEINAGGDVSCDGVEGNVTAGGDVGCDNVSGDVEAGGDIDCDRVYGSVTAGGDVDCGSVAGNVHAEGDVDCGSVGGSVSGGDVNYSRSSRGTGGKKGKTGRIVWNGKDVGSYSYDTDGNPIDLGDLGKTISDAVQESVKSVRDALRGKR